MKSACVAVLSTLNVHVKSFSCLKKAALCEMRVWKRGGKVFVKQFMFFFLACSHVLYIINAKATASAKWGTIKLKVISFYLNDSHDVGKKTRKRLSSCVNFASREKYTIVWGLIMKSRHKKVCHSQPSWGAHTFMCDVWHLYNLSSTTGKRKESF